MKVRKVGKSNIKPLCANTPHKTKADIDSFNHARSDSVIYHDSLSIFFKVADSLFLSWGFSFIPDLAILLTRNRVKDVRNKKASSVFFIACTMQRVPIGGRSFLYDTLT
jgi:hypothetical protein